MLTGLAAPIEFVGQNRAAAVKPARTSLRPTPPSARRAIVAIWRHSLLPPRATVISQRGRYAAPFDASQYYSARLDARQQRAL